MMSSTLKIISEASVAEKMICSLTCSAVCQIASHHHKLRSGQGYRPLISPWHADTYREEGVQKLSLNGWEKAHSIMWL